MRGLSTSVVTLILMAIVVSISPGQLAAQEPSSVWLVVQFKISMVEGKPLRQVTGPIPSSSLCDTMLKFAQEGLSKQGLEVTSMACRNDITMIVPDRGAPASPPPSQAPSEGH
ncbi:MAG: hypothetical protein AUH31_02370 [Armatimonadetes bacterium 13_1_40CM_64_14]|nr:MAG: hypothetical protein AUH31_02370 [Armatimonadetes bacterium 13_1_40CM_64_14]